jgi:hypothetical protein
MEADLEFYDETWLRLTKGTNYLEFSDEILGQRLNENRMRGESELAHRLQQRSETPGVYYATKALALFSLHGGVHVNKWRQGRL